jgi:hypothetical protein
MPPQLSERGQQTLYATSPCHRLWRLPHLRAVRAAADDFHPRGSLLRLLREMARPGPLGIRSPRDIPRAAPPQLRPNQRPKNDARNRPHLFSRQRRRHPHRQTPAPQTIITNRRLADPP